MMRSQVLTVAFFLGGLINGNSLRKVLVPAVHKEWEDGMPDWAHNKTYHREHNFDVFIYQKLHSSEPNFIAHNRGSEAGVYLRYIVDHYHDFPDVAMFIHANPQDHSPNFLQLLKCVHPNARYVNINLGPENSMCRDTASWFMCEMWVEQCWRDVLKIAWGLKDNSAEFHKRMPPDEKPSVCFYKSQQFILSRSQVQRRPLSVWKELLFILGEDDVCHRGEPDYENLYSYRVGRRKWGPEQAHIAAIGEKVGQGWGRYTQGGAAEYLAHVIYGFEPMKMTIPLTMETICSNFLPEAVCPGSPCNHRNETLRASPVGAVNGESEEPAVTMARVASRREGVAQNRRKKRPGKRGPRTQAGHAGQSSHVDQAGDAGVGVGDAGVGVGDAGVGVGAMVRMPNIL